MIDVIGRYNRSYRWPSLERGESNRQLPRGGIESVAATIIAIIDVYLSLIAMQAVVLEEFEEPLTV